MKIHSTTTSLIAATLLAAVSISGVMADDTELYLDQITLPPEQIRPNVVFILDSSGSMGLPVKVYGTSSEEETNNYDHSQTYAGSANTNGGAGDTNFYYLYRQPNTFADQFVYYNKVHTSQMTCDMSTLGDSTPYTTSDDNFIYDDGTANWGHLCDANNTSCSFNAVSGGALVDCDSEQNHITANSAYPSQDLYVVSANFHNFLQQYYRYSVLQTVVKDLIDKPFDINMSLMKFNGGSGGIVIKESVDANLISNQSDLKTVVNGILADGTTPLTESLWEASRYLRGENATYGSTANGGVAAAFSSGTTYDSPIEYACQKNHIILLTDGNANSDGGRDSSIRSLTGSNCSHSDNADSPGESCLDDYAGWLHADGSNRRDHSTGGGGLTGVQSITVHTIGFGLDNPLLTATAEANGSPGEPGLAKTAATAAELEDAFSTILNQLEFEKDTFVAPAVAVNAYNGLQHRDELYFALFQPNSSPRWGGNIKKYLLDGDTIKDSNNNTAIDLSTGYFKDTALSFWTNPANLPTGLTGDGGSIDKGGFASELSDPSSRTIYTYTGTGSPSNLTLSEILEDANANITAAMLGVDTAANPASERTNILNWARSGVTGDANSPPNFFVADFIHNRPAVVTYNTIVDSDGNATFDDTVFAASNMGFFHAVDPDDGSEVFAFVPKELYGNLTTYYQNVGGFTDKVYGLDAPMTVWRNDANNDNNIVDTDNDHVYIYQSMRRGGSHIYALDVTKRNSPKLLWQIEGTALDTTPSGNFSDLAQTWSVPQYGKVKWACTASGCTDKDVLFFGGGYDPVHDDELANSPPSSSKGAAIYMVDAKTGALLWSAGNTGHSLNISGMKHSIAANVTIGDVDSDGYIDFLFAVDITGNIWRIDFAKDSTTAFSNGGLIAEFGGTGSNFRRFYNAPDVAYFAKRGNAPFLTVSVSSGYRAHPRNTSINDYLFVMYDKNALKAPDSFDYRYVNGSSTIDLSDLSATGNQYGWYTAFAASGEKGLSRTITFGDQIIMTTYLPESSNTCTGTTGGGRYYLLDALSGVSLLKDSGGNTIPYGSLTHGGIPPEPAVIYSTEDVCVANCEDTDDTNDTTEERTNLVVCVGTECVDDVVDQKLHKTFWREN